MSEPICEILDSTFQPSNHSYKYSGTNGTTGLLQVGLLNNVVPYAAIKNADSICTCSVFHLTVSHFLAMTLSFLTEARE